MGQHLGDTKLHDLSEDVLCGIFSRLSIRDAARASASCSTLLRAWRRYPHLTFDVDTLRLPLHRSKRSVYRSCKHRDEIASEFVRIVETTMTRHRVGTSLDRRVCITDEDLERFLSCHKLQILKLKHCDDLGHLKLSARQKQLRFLSVHWCSSMRTIDASDSVVASLRFVGDNRARSVLGEEAPAPKVTTASFHLWCMTSAPADDRRFDPTHLAHHLPGLQHLFLTFVWPVEMRIVAPPNGIGNKIYHLKRLELKMEDFVSTDSSGRDHLLFMHQFLDAAPVLDLSLHLMRLATALDDPGADSRFRKHPRRPHGILKTATITGFEADLASLELALYILENARALERLSLDPAWSGHNGSSDLEKLCVGTPEWPHEIRLAREAILRHIAPAVTPGSGVQLQIL